ncbi:SHOCT domain-containing protein [Candidatus Nitrosacidococcus tergens]|uniref:Uncharacterized protein n=1 Tax=Candidatus Nitrosacidococcus tergens TaxID=553981 RepID=A0A7G1Q6Y6_9GAMM|nr:SHOCT domain-containing protein [Candidatus Nitrosacidococcus tergens]CAB1274131.1 conserved protein of unknown function [Candidatus Nitrosacidococcus tergens]
MACSFHKKAIKKEESSNDSKDKVIWNSGDQYISLNTDDRVTSNQHPVSITESDMRTILESLTVPKRQLLVQEEIQPIFSSAEILQLSTYLPKGLALADSDQDIVFVIMGFKKGIMAKERVVNTGRVFFMDNKLNIIFGKLQEEVRDRDRQTGESIDRRLHPFTVGSRRFESKIPTTITLGDGKAFYLDYKSNKMRKDWLVLDVPTILAEAKNSNNKAESEASGTGNTQISAKALEDINNNKLDIQNMKKDLSGIKEVLFELKEYMLELQQEK